MEEYQDDELGDAAFVDFGEMPDLPDEGLPDTSSEIEDAELPSPEN